MLQDGALCRGLTDTAGNSSYELAISGSRPLVQKVFAKTDLGFTINPKASDDDWPRHFQEIWRKSTAALRKRPPAAGGKRHDRRL